MYHTSILIQTDPIKQKVWKEWKIVNTVVRVK